MDQSGMTLATASYAKFRPGSGTPVRITLGAPKMRLRYPLRYEVPDLAPKSYYFRWGAKRFNDEYLAQLDRVGVESLARQFRDIAVRSQDSTLVFLCFEDLAQPGVGCHRELFAMWWETQTGQVVPELGPVHQPRPWDLKASKAELDQPRLF